VSEVGHNITLGLTRKSLHATVIRACPHCGAPGVKDQKPVGAICPNCGNKRLPDRNLGELAASMPIWIWNLVLACKWLWVQLRT
jgi:DNA-directed RNA polymerase subunit RPC12/RpoP